VKKEVVKYRFVFSKSVFLIAGLLSLYFTVPAQQYTEYEVKAAYLFNFGKFIEWPAQTEYVDANTYLIGIYRNNPFGNILDKALKGRMINNRKIVIKRIFTLEEIKNCQILFISDITKAEMEEVLTFLQKKPVLTVGDNLDHFCESGGIINFTHQYAKSRFYINNKVAIRAGLTISSKLLSLAKIVTEDEVKF
jgi:hypothetical protein